MKCLTSLTLMLACALGTVQAQQAQPRTLEQTVEIATRHPLLQQRLGQVQAAKGSEQAAQGAQWLQITGDAQAGVQTYRESGYNDTTGVLEGGVGFSQPLLDGGRRSAVVTEMDSRLLEAGRNLAWQQRLQKYLAEEAHTNLWLSQKLAEQTAQDLEFLTKITSSTEQRFAMSDATKTEVSEANARLDAARALQDQRRTDIGVARGNYIRAVGETVDVVADPSPAITLGPVPPYGIHPLVQAAQAARDQARARLGQREAGDYPTLDLQGNVRRNQYDGTFRDTASTSGRLVLNLGYTFWDSGITRGEKAEAKGQLLAANANLQATELEVASYRASALSRWQNAEKRLHNSENALSDATITVQLLVKEVQMGNRTLRELLDAQRDMTGAMTAWLQAYASRAIAWYDLERWQ